VPTRPAADTSSRPSQAKRITIRDVAREAGVSVTTVSTALSGNGRLAADTRERVSAAAQRLGYVASPSARFLRSARTGSIGLCLPDQVLSLEYYMQLAFGAAAEAMAHDLALTLVPPNASTAQLAGMPVEGMIVVDPLIDDPILTRLRPSGLPVVTCEVDPSGRQHAGSVAGDNTAGVRRMLDHLTAQGAVTVAVIAPPETTSWSIESLAAYRGFCSDHGIPVRLATVGFVSTPESERAAVEQILAGGPVDAILSLPDGGAAAALQVAGAHGLRVPQDIMIASGVDSAVMALSTPQITALELNPREMGGRATSMLARLLSGHSAGESELVPVELVPRASTARRA